MSGNSEGSSNSGSSLKTIDLDNPLKHILREQGYGTIIHHWGVIGDSLASGEFVGAPNGNIDCYEYSWVHRFAKLNNAEHECGHNVIDVRFMKTEEMKNGIIGKPEFDEFEWIEKITPFNMMDTICFATDVE